MIRKWADNQQRILKDADNEDMPFMGTYKIQFLNNTKNIVTTHKQEIKYQNPRLKDILHSKKKIKILNS